MYYLLSYGTKVLVVGMMESKTFQMIEERWGPVRNRRVCFATFYGHKKNKGYISVP